MQPTSTTVPFTSSVTQECFIRIAPSFQRVLSLQSATFTVQSSGLCNDSDYEWSVDSTIRSSCDQHGNYRAGSNPKLVQAAFDTIRVIDHANGGISAQAYVKVFPGCPVTQLYGVNSEEVRLLRKFRDDVAGTTPEGKQLVTLYYQWGPMLSAAIEENEAFKVEMKKLVDAFLPALRTVMD